MSNKTVRQLAEVVGIPLETLLEQLKDANLTAKSADDIISEDEKVKLLSHLRQRHGKGNDNAAAPKRVTLKRRTVSELKQTKVSGENGKTISVEVRKKRTYVKRSEAGLSEEQKQLERDKATLNEQHMLLEQQEKEEAEKERLLNEEQERLAAEQEKQRKIKEAEEQAKREAEQSAKEKAEKEQVEREKAEKEKAEKERQELIKKEEQRKKAQIAEQKSKPSPVKGEEDAKKVARVKEKPKKPAVSKEKNVNAPSKNKRSTGSDNKRSAGSDKKRGNRRRDKQAYGQNIKQDAKHQFEKPVTPVVKEVAIPDHIIVSDLAQKMSVKAAEVIKQLMKLGMMATINQSIDQETAMILVEELGHKAIPQSDDDLEKEMLAGLDSQEVGEEARAPIVTIMGHVDHGKTSLLDYIRESRIAAGEAGGITQHIGAYQVKTDHGSVTFLDTPGHAAFTAMRARGAQVTDVVIIVVAADDGVMPQTKEAVEHARAAEVPIIVAINKIDKPEADPQRVMQELVNIEVIPEEWGGDVQFMQVSAKTGAGIDELIEALILQSEILELTAPVEGSASGFVIEARLDKGRGPVATVLVQKGTLKKGEIVLCGHEYGRVRAMFDENGRSAKEAGPSAPVEILGLSGAPQAGEDFLVAPNERAARELAEHREDKSRLSKHAEQHATKLDEVFSKMEAGEMATLNLVIKTDVQGSLEALKESLVKLSNDEVQVKVVYGGVGGINEGDANLALASSAIIIGFNVRADATARKLIAEKDIDLHYYSIIYNAIDEVKKSISGLLSPELRESIVGIAEVRDIFRSPKFGSIAGCMVSEGFVKRNLPIRVLRDNVVIYEGQLESLRRFKDDANEVKAGMECGIGVKNYNDVKIGDQIEVFEQVEVIREI